MQDWRNSFDATQGGGATQPGPQGYSVGGEAGSALSYGQGSGPSAQPGQAGAHPSPQAPATGSAAQPRREERSKPIQVEGLVPLLELSNRIGHVYGSEDIGLLFYSLIRREKPMNLVEVGTGLGVTALWMGQAVKENGGGKVWTLDDASQWQNPEQIKVAVAPLLEVPPFDAFDLSDMDYAAFVQNCIHLLGLTKEVSFLQKTLDPKQEAAFTPDNYVFLQRPIDFLFLDVNRTPEDILNSLTLFLPHMAESASIFIDSASTSLTGYLFLEQLVEQLNRGKVPRRFTMAAAPERRQALSELVATRRFTLMHLVERVARAQNSTAWLRIEPNDYIPHPQTLMKWV